MSRDHPTLPPTLDLDVDALVRTGGLGPIDHERYEDLGLISQGATAQVRRVRDQVMDRLLAMKVLHRGLVENEAARLRFSAEAGVTARLQHPGVVPVHDQGELPDGRLWFTMKEVRGRTLAELMEDERDDDEPALRRRIALLARICDAVSYAHSLGVVHRDLKPANLMVGEFGEVLVMDWGLALAPGDEEPAGVVVGTPSYMAPEQASPGEEELTTAADVYALGSVLYELLAGRAPYDGSGVVVLAQLQRGPPPGLETLARGLRPVELIRICEQAMARAPADRFPHAGVLGRELRAWLDGVRRRAQAAEVLDQAHALAPRIDALRAQAAELREQAASAAAPLDPAAPEELKIPVWHLEDRAAELERRAVLEETRRLQAAHAALNLAPDLDEAHALLARHYTAALLEAEAARRPHDAVRYEALLRSHAGEEHAALLAGLGSFSLRTEPAGAELRLLRFRERNRRLVPVPVEPGTPSGPERPESTDDGDVELRTEQLPTPDLPERAPVVRASVPRGSYLVEARAPGTCEVRIPLLVTRGGHVEVNGGAPIPLPPRAGLGPNDVYVPAGVFHAGGDPEAAEALPRTPVNVPGFIMRRYPVTCAEYLLFLNDLLETGRADEAERAAPTARLAGGSDHGGILRTGDRYVLCEDSDGLLWKPDWPVTLVDWHGARGYCDWLAAREGLPWRLPNALEWEKAARGPDGRFCPWGDYIESTWACVLNGRPGPPSRASVHDFPADESPYGVRGMAGNVREWCGHAWERGGPRLVDGRLVIERSPDEAPDLVEVRGGAWTSVPKYCRSATRFAARPEQRFTTLGLRPVRSLAD